MKRITDLLLIVALTGLVAACDSEAPDHDGAGENELITRVTLMLSGGVTASAADPDGDGLDIQVDTLVLTTGAAYTGSISFRDDINNIDLTGEVEEEAEEHQVFFTLGGDLASGAVLAVTDEDENGLPIGLAFTIDVTAESALTGTLNVVLSHYDDAPKDGTTRSQETDVDVTFPVKVMPAP